MIRRNQPTVPTSFRARLAGLGALLALLAAAPAAASPSAGAYLVFDARSGEVISKYNADQSWYPASVTKLMTTWVTLQAIRAGRITQSTPVVMTADAARQPPSKMGFLPGQWVTVDDALKIIMVKSANDVAWALGETVGGSKEAFVDEMNRQAARLGMTRTHWGNPNGLPDPTQTTTARDLGILARALLTEFPGAEDLWHLPGIRFGKSVIRNHNNLLGRFPGADGMKTGFICSAGFNVVASATRGRRKLITVVLGGRTARQRDELAAELFTKGFENGNDGGLFGRFTAPETIYRMARGSEAANPVRDIRPFVCGKQRGEPDEDIGDDGGSVTASRDPGAVIRPGEAAAAPARRVSYLLPRFDIGEPVPVSLGSGNPGVPGGTMMALATEPEAAAMPPQRPTGPDPSVAVVPVRPGAIAGDALIGRPATGPGAGAGVAAALPPADGAPMLIAAPGLIPPTMSPAALTTPQSRLPLEVDTPAPAPRTATQPRKPAAAKPTRTAERRSGTETGHRVRVEIDAPKPAAKPLPKKKPGTH